MKIRPLHDRVMFGAKKKNKPRRNIIARFCTGEAKPEEVVAVGGRRILDNGEVRAVDVKVGDTVVLGQYAGNDKIDVDGETNNPQ